MINGKENDPNYATSAVRCLNNLLKTTQFQHKKFPQGRIQMAWLETSILVKLINLLNRKTPTINYFTVNWNF